MQTKRRASRDDDIPGPWVEAAEDAVGNVVQQIVCHRVVPIQDQLTGPEDEEQDPFAAGSVREYLVKLKGASYLHAQWVSHANLMADGANRRKLNLYVVPA